MVNMEVSNKGMTVDQLWQLCVNMRRLGYGKRHVLLSEDDECNGFHSLWSGFETDPAEIHEIRAYCCDAREDLPDEEVVLLM